MKYLILEWIIIALIFIFAAVYALKQIARQIKFCRHNWVNGRGYISIGKGVSVEYNGPRCTKCWKCKDAPWIIEVKE